MSEFFIHDQIIQAIRHLHPDLVHGKEFLVLMGIEPDDTPASDAWIERWPAGVPMPTMQELRTAYQAALLAPVPPPPPATSTSPLAYMARFTDAEKAAIYSAALSNAQVLRWVTELAASQEVVFADPRLSAGMDALVVAGLLTQARAQAILPLGVRGAGAAPP